MPPAVLFRHSKRPGHEAVGGSGVVRYAIIPPDAARGEQYLPQLHEPCPEATGAALQVVFPHTAETLVIAVLEFRPVVREVPIPGPQGQHVVEGERVPIFKHEITFVGLCYLAG